MRIIARPIFLLLLIFGGHNLGLGQDRLDYFEAEHKLVDVLLETLAEVEAQVVVLAVVKVEGGENERGCLPIGLDEVLVIALVFLLIGYSFFLLDQTDDVCDVDLVILVVRLEVAVHRQFKVHTLLLEGCCRVGTAS